MDMIHYSIIISICWAYIWQLMFNMTFLLLIPLNDHRFWGAPPTRSYRDGSVDSVGCSTFHSTSKPGKTFREASWTSPGEICKIQRRLESTKSVLGDLRCVVMAKPGWTFGISTDHPSISEDVREADLEKLLQESAKEHITRALERWVCFKHACFKNPSWFVIHVSNQNGYHGIPRRTELRARSN